jgi:hypothetical protein
LPYLFVGVVGVLRQGYAATMPLACATYQPRETERGVLYRIVDAHLDAFFETAAQHAEGARLPAFIEQEFREFLACGVMAHGFARLLDKLKLTKTNKEFLASMHSMG